MQNLSLQMAQLATQNKAEISAGKVNAVMDKNASAEQNATFKMVLSKQVQSQQTPAKQAATQPGKAQKMTDKATTDKEAVENNVEAAALHAKRKAKAINGQHILTTPIGDDKKTNSINADIALISNPDSPSVYQTKLEAITSFGNKDEVDTKSENVNINLQDSSAIALSAATLALGMNSNPLVNTQVTTATTEPKLSSQFSSQVATEVEDSPSKQYDLDAMLSNAISQSKNINISERSIVEPKVALEDLVNTAKFGQLDAVAKEVIMPTGLQPSAQVNVTSSVQQVAIASVVNAYPGRAGWDQAISQKVVWMVGAGQQSATLTLNPPDLGPLQVMINVHNDQTDATFISNNAEVRQALLDGMSNLRDKMSESGLQLGQANVSSGQQSQQQFNQAMQSQHTSPANNENALLPLEKTTGTTTLSRISNGLVDTFA
ncbi:MAG: flagellar hook-length control protein FliK [Methylotenera sp.]|nr:flagellar hook-length control protein FliK [Methylotenera sp.]